MATRDSYDIHFRNSYLLLEKEALPTIPENIVARVLIIIIIFVENHLFESEQCFCSEESCRVLRKILDKQTEALTRTKRGK